MDTTFKLVDGGRAIQCLNCGTTSHNPTDVVQRYCGFCHRFHDETEDIEALDRLRTMHVEPR